MGAALIDVSLILVKAWQRARQANAEQRADQEDWKRTNIRRLVVWVVFWGVGDRARRLAGSAPAGRLSGHGSAAGVRVRDGQRHLGRHGRSNPISSAFVVTVVLMAAIGLKDPIVGLIAATVLLVSTSEACDMQQDRSTGWRLGTNRTIQFRFQVAGIVMGAIMAVVFAQAVHERVSGAAARPDRASRRSAARAMDVGDDLQVRRRAAQPDRGQALPAHRDLGRRRDRLRDRAAAQADQVARPGYQRFVAVGQGRASAPTSCSTRWCCRRRTRRRSAASSTWRRRRGLPRGGVFRSLVNSLPQARSTASDAAEDMSTTSLVGGGLIAGDALAALGLGIAGLLSALSG